MSVQQWPKMTAVDVVWYNFKNEKPDRPAIGLP